MRRREFFRSVFAVPVALAAAFSSSPPHRNATDIAALFERKYIEAERAMRAYLSTDLFA